MGQKGKALVIILIILVIISLCLAGGVYYLLSQEQAKSQTLQGELANTQAKQKAAEAKINKLQDNISDLSAKLQETVSQVGKLNSDLELEKNGHQEALTQVEQIRLDLEQQKSLRADLENRLLEAKKDVINVQTELKNLSVKKSELEKKIADLEAQAKQDMGVELGTVVVNPDTAAVVEPQKPVKKSKQKKAEKAKTPLVSAPETKASPQTETAKNTPSVLEGKVLVVNKDYDFVVLNIGSKDGVGLGNIFSIYHNNDLLGEAKVEKLHDSMAAAGLSPADIKMKLSEGDRVIRKSLK